MITVRTWFAGQYGGDSADCNPEVCWQCSRVECSRHYEPRVFGYRNLERGRGNRPNPKEQENCSRHCELPFMFVASFGPLRQFRCPFRGCDNRGSVVSEFVANIETAIEDQLEPVASLTHEAKTEAHELAIFHVFAIAANLRFKSPRNKKPPFPDIECIIDGELHWFELGRITDYKFAGLIKDTRRDNPKPFLFSQEEPFVRIVEKKKKKRYTTLGHPVDLVLYFDQQPPDQKALKRYFSKHAATLEDLQKKGPFSRVWIYDDWSKSVLWSSEPSISRSYTSGPEGSGTK